MTREEVFAGLEKRGDTFVKKADDSYVRVMTCNVMDHKGPEPDGIGYHGRTDIMAGMCAYYLPDVIGFQEMALYLKEEFVEKFSDIYSFVESPTGERFKRGIWIPYHNYAPIAYNKHRLDLLEHRYHAFVIPSAWSYQWALYADKKDPTKRFIHMNLYYIHRCGVEQVPGIRDVHAELTHLRRQYGNTPIFVTGDYNCPRTHSNFDMMIEGLNMESGVFIAEDAEENATGYWCHSVGSMELQRNPSAIDHITVTTDLCRVKLHRVLHDELLCKSSDHCARLLDIEIKEKEVL